MTTTSILKISKAVKGMETMDGENARVFRLIGTPMVDTVDPFLMLDEFHVTKPGGFPNHPHRGFETVTYMLGGAFKHKDNSGHAGTIYTNDVQWMTAGRGIVHSEMPATDDDNFGLQLWVNLPAKDKMIPPFYQEYKGTQLPAQTLDAQGTELRVIAGSSHGLTSPITLKIPILYVDVILKQNNHSFVESIPANFQGFVYVFEGAVEIAGTTYQQKHLLVFDESSEARTCTVTCKSTTQARFFIIAGKPIKEPVSKYGPFVMNTRQEIMQAIQDYQNGKFTST